jgi:LCP family protein required for cell wall assembly
MPDQPPAGPPEYNVYRSRRRPLGGLKRPDPFRRKRPQAEEPGFPRERRPLGWKRVLKWVLVAAVTWIALSLVLFLLSAALQQGVSKRTEQALSPGGSLVTGSTILVIGSDKRSKQTAEPGSGGPGRSDSLMLLHVGLGSVRKLSIPRDSEADIPGHGIDKINAAYAIGGAALTIETVEKFMGNSLRINHVIEVSFENFPDFINAIGGVDVTVRRCIRSQPFGGRRFKLRRGKHHLNGRQALAFARVRKNACSPNEDDRARARRQQQVLASIRDQLVSPTTFFRLPWVAWAAPRTIVSDMSGPSLLVLFADLMTGGPGKARVLEFDGPGQTAPGSVHVPDSTRAREVRRLLG